MEERNTFYEKVCNLVDETFPGASEETREIFVAFSLYVATYEALKVIAKQWQEFKVKEEVLKNE